MSNNDCLNGLFGKRIRRLFDVIGYAASHWPDGDPIRKPRANDKVSRSRLSSVTVISQRTFVDFDGQEFCSQPALPISLTK